MCALQQTLHFINKSNFPTRGTNKDDMARVIGIDQSNSLDEQRGYSGKHWLFGYDEIRIVWKKQGKYRANDRCPRAHQGAFDQAGSTLLTQHVQPILESGIL